MMLNFNTSHDGVFNWTALETATFSTSGPPHCYPFIIPPPFQDITLGHWLYYLNIAYIYPIQFTIGLFGNGLFLSVLCQPRMRASKTNLIIAALATADIAFFLGTAPIQIRAIVTSLNNNYNYYIFYLYAQIAGAGISNWMSFVSIWLTVAVSIERLLVVAYPLHVRSLLRNRYIIGIILSIYVAGLILNLHFFICRRVTPIKVCRETIAAANPSELAGLAVTNLKNLTSENLHNLIQNGNSTAKIDYNGTEYYTYMIVIVKNVALRRYFWGGIIAATVLMVFVPFVLIIVLNGILVRIILAQSKYRAGMTASGSIRGANSIHNGQRTGTSMSDEQKVTRLVLIMILSFIICNLASAIVAIFDLGNLYPNRTVKTFFTQVSNIAVTTGKATNFFIFAFGSQRFRKELAEQLRRIFRCCCCGCIMAVETLDDKVDNAFTKGLRAALPSKAGQGQNSKFSSDDRRRTTCTSLNAYSTTCTKFSPLIPNSKAVASNNASPLISVRSEENSEKLIATSSFIGLRRPGAQMKLVSFKGAKPSTRDEQNSGDSRQKLLGPDYLTMTTGKSLSENNNLSTTANKLQLEVCTGRTDITISNYNLNNNYDLNGGQTYEQQVLTTSSHSDLTTRSGTTDVTNIPDEDTFLGN